MKRHGTRSVQVEAVKSKVHRSRFTPVLDSRKRKVRGIVTRNGKYYAQMRVALPNGKSKAIRTPLTAARLDDAIAEAEKKRTEKRAGNIHLPGHRPKFSDLVTAYQVSAVFRAKKKGTRDNETQALKRWVGHLGGVRIDWIKEDAMTAFRDQRARGGAANRTINLDVTAFNNAMRYAVDCGYLAKAPKIKKLKEQTAPRRPPLSAIDIQAILDAAPRATKNAELLKFYVRFLVATGAREQEALKIRKIDVDLARGVVHIGADGDTKNNKSRDVQFNSSLQQVATELLATLPPDTQWLFPSPQRGTKDVHAKSLRESFYATRDVAGRGWVGFHDFRHYFASQCVMAGIDFMTIAEWLGHSDGGILVGTTYGHLNDLHKRRMAAGLSLLQVPANVREMTVQNSVA